MKRPIDGSQEQPSDRPPLREVSPEELQEIIGEHRKWLESGADKGTRADLARANLPGRSLVAVSLQEADLSGANLEGAYLTESNLRGANLAHASALFDFHFSLIHGPTP